MAEETIIAWTDATFNPWMGCVKVSDGCKHCYAERLTRDRMGLSLWGAKAKRQITSAANWKKPVAWNRQAERDGLSSRVFCPSLCDVFESRPDLLEPRARLWDLIRATSNLDWQILTKRPHNIRSMLPADWGSGWPHVWLGTSIEDQTQDWRAECLARIPAAVRFVSYEPALGPLDCLDLSGMSWVVYGGESGPSFRPENKAWARSMRDKCAAAGVAFFHKQSSATRTEQGVELDGIEIKQYPRPRRKLSEVRSCKSPSP